MKNWKFIFFISLTVLTACNHKGSNKLQCFKLSEVRITGGPFYQAQQTDLKYMLELEPDRLLAPFLQNAGIRPVKESYGNWENIGLDGHTAGHYLSALAFMYASTGNKELLKRIDYMIDWLQKCQEKDGNGYVGGIPNGKEMWDEISQGIIDARSFTLNKRWVPLYNMHKLFAGLRDVYENTGNEKSLDILVKLTDWFIETTKNLSDEQVQEILKCEQGGIAEIFVDVAGLTGDDKYLKLAKRFSDKALLELLFQKKNEFNGLHANTQIAKVVGYKRYADVTNDTAWSAASDFFWNAIIDHYTVSIGGNSVGEHLNPADDFSSMIGSNQGLETCVTYNMLRLTEIMLLSNPKAKYIDYYERALFNHILSAQNTTKGGFVYFTPMRPQHYRVYSQPQLCNWCCVGSGLENYSKSGELIYMHDDNDLYVNLFIPSQLSWKEKGISLTQTTDFPYSEMVELKVQLNKPGKFGLNIRRPKWVKEGGFGISINGKEQKIVENSGTYVKIDRKWNDGDIVSIKLPMKTTVEYLPDHSHWASFIHGPIVLAAISDSSNLDGLWADDSRMGHVAGGKLYPIDESPAIVAYPNNLISNLKTVEGKPFTFSLDAQVNLENSKSIELKPFFEIHEARYIIYWPIVTPEELKLNKEELKRSERDLLALEARTVDRVAPGDQQQETDHDLKGENTKTGFDHEKYWRDAAGWFSYDLMDKNKEGCLLRITYYGPDRDREFQILVNETLLATVKIDGTKYSSFYDADYIIPQNIIEKSKDILKVKFVAINGKVAGGVYYIRLMKGD